MSVQNDALTIVELEERFETTAVATDSAKTVNIK